ncbi:MAG: cation:proton antiporter, partial [Leifsonia sp.]
LLPVFLVLFLVVRGLPSSLATPPGASRSDRTALTILGATGLPIIVAVTNIGIDQGDITTGTAASLVGAGLLSVLLFPLIGLAIHKRSSGRVETHPESDAFIDEEG